MGRLGRWFARWGTPGGTARWAVQGYKAFQRHVQGDHADSEVFRWLITTRYRVLRNNKYQDYLLAKADTFEGLMGLVVEVLKVETSLSELPGEAMADFLRVIQDELKRSSLPHDVLFAQSYGISYYMEQAYSLTSRQSVAPIVEPGPKSGSPARSDAASTCRHSGESAEQTVLKMKEVGVIDYVPDDPNTFMKDVEALSHMAKTWASCMRNDPDMITRDGLPAYKKVYPLAVRHFATSSGISLDENDEQEISAASQHFETWWRNSPELPQEPSGEPDWFTIYGQVQSHYGQWLNGRIP